MGSRHKAWNDDRGISAPHAALIEIAADKEKAPEAIRPKRLSITVTPTLGEGSGVKPSTGSGRA